MKFTAVARDDVAARGAHPRGHATRGLAGARLLSPPEHPLWLVDIDLDDGGTVAWDDAHGDEALYLIDGTLEVGGRTCPPGGAVVVEAGVPARAVARGRVRGAHFGSAQPAPGKGGQVHVFGPGGQWVSGRLEGVRAVWFTDSTCPTCRAALFVVSSEDAHRAPRHSHTQDEIIYLLGGAVRMGAHRYGAGTALCIPGGVPYAFEGLPGGHRFVNFRAGVSYQTNAGEAPRLETAAAREGEYVGDVR